MEDILSNCSVGLAVSAICFIARVVEMLFEFFSNQPSWLTFLQTTTQFGLLLVWFGKPTFLLSWLVFHFLLSIVFPVLEASCKLNSSGIMDGACGDKWGAEELEGRVWGGERLVYPYLNTHLSRLGGTAVTACLKKRRNMYMFIDLASLWFSTVTKYICVLQDTEETFVIYTYFLGQDKSPSVALYSVGW